MIALRLQAEMLLVAGERPECPIKGPLVSGMLMTP
jgi:hypothetical protein